jgi:hypothetical protein
MIKSFVVGNNKFEYPIFLFEYLEPYIEEFSKTSSLVISDELEIPETCLNEFTNLIKEVFRKLVITSYQSPNIKQRSKYSTRYQKLIFEGNEYVVDYRKDLAGKTLYALDYLISWLHEKSRNLS